MRDRQRAKIEMVQVLESLRRGIETLMYEIDGNPKRRSRRALGRTALQDPQPSVFDGEFDVLHVFEFPLELHEVTAELRGDGGSRLGELFLGLRATPP